MEEMHSTMYGGKEGTELTCLLHMHHPPAYQCVYQLKTFLSLIVSEFLWKLHHRGMIY